MKHLPYSRRKLLKQIMSLSVGATALTSSQILFLNGAHADTNACTFTDPDEYKALVCIFLYGGNDSLNMLVPMAGEARSHYEILRQDLVRTNCLEIFPSQAINGGLGFVPEMQALKDLFDQGALAIQAGVGPLVEPLTLNGSPIPGATAYPNGLYAHDVQQGTWQRGADVNQSGFGWAGRMMDALHATQTDNQYLRSISLAGQNLWESGIEHSPYSLSTDGLAYFDLYNKGHLQGVRAPIAQQYINEYAPEHLLERAYINTFRAANDNATALQVLLDNTEDITTPFPSENGLASQLEHVAKLIRVGKENNLARQVFFVGMGGFDTHANQISEHPLLLKQVSDAMAAFYNATIEQGIENQVTSFTMSDFGRNPVFNGRGTDHGWTGNQLILGGSVNADVYGHIPEQKLNMSLTPSTATEEMFASLAKWFGVSECERHLIFPNLNKFALTNGSLSVDYFS